MGTEPMEASLFLFYLLLHFLLYCSIMTTSYLLWGL